MKNILTLAIILAVSTLSFAQETNELLKYGIDASEGIPRGINVGTIAPDFSSLSSTGVPVTLSTELKKGNVVLIFYRGEWCPVCNRYLSNLQDSLSYIIEKGAIVLAITPEIPASAEKMKEKTGATFTVIPDPDESIMHNYDVVFDVTKAYQQKILTALETDIATNNGKDKARLPVPATFIIDKKGVIVWKQFDPDYHHRATIKEIITNLPE